MRANAEPMPGKCITWVLVADGKQAQIYECLKTIRNIPLGGVNIHHYFNEKSGIELAPVPDGTLTAETIDSYQIGHDRRGTSSSSVSSVHNTYEPHGNIEEELKRHFVKAIAAKLDRACAEKSFDRLVLVAPARMVGEIREQLTAEAQKRIAAVLPKDLTHYRGQALIEHLHDTLTEAHLA
jgi:protein required for attachment to host cells